MPVNTAVFKTPGFWVALVASLIGIVLSQHVVAEGSTVAAALGWVMTLLGAGAAGHQVASVPPRALD